MSTPLPTEINLDDLSSYKNDDELVPINTMLPFPLALLLQRIEGSRWKCFKIGVLMALLSPACAYLYDVGLSYESTILLASSMRWMAVLTILLPFLAKAKNIEIVPPQIRWFALRNYRRIARCKLVALQYNAGLVGTLKHSDRIVSTSDDNLLKGVMSTFRDKQVQIEEEAHSIRTELRELREYIKKKCAHRYGLVAYRRLQGDYEKVFNDGRPSGVNTVDISPYVTMAAQRDDLVTKAQELQLRQTDPDWAPLSTRLGKFFVRATGVVGALAIAAGAYMSDAFITSATMPWLFDTVGMELRAAESPRRAVYRLYGDKRVVVECTSNHADTWRLLAVGENSGREALPDRIASGEPFDPEAPTQEPIEMVTLEYNSSDIIEWDAIERTVDTDVNFARCDTGDQIERSIHDYRRYVRKQKARNKKAQQD